MNFTYPINTFPLANKIRITNPAANLDVRYGPWLTLLDALTSTANVRDIGLTVGIIENNKVVEYHFLSGTTDNDLVVKSIDTSILSNFLPLSGGTITNDLNVLGNILSGGVNLATFLTGTIASLTSFQTLFYLESSYELSISDGNTVSLSSINTTFNVNSGRYEQLYSLVEENSSLWQPGVSAIQFLELNNDFLLTITGGNSVSLSGLNYQGTDLKALSSNWQDTYTNVQSNSSNWESTYTNVQSNSANWDYQGTDLKALSGNWQDTYTNVQSNSSNWQDTYTNVQSNSANWNYQGTDLKELSGNWESTYTNVQSNSSNWDYQGTDLKELSGNWQDTYTNVQSNSSNWDYQGTDLKALSSNWESTYTNVQSNSANWDYQGLDLKALSGNWESTYTNVQSNSANWDLQTVLTHLSTNSVLISSLNVINNLQTDQFLVNSRAVFVDQIYYSTDEKVSQLSALSGNYDEGQYIGEIKLSQNNNILTNIGENWISKLSSQAWYGIAMSADGKYITAVVFNGQIYISNDYGNTWNSTGLTKNYYRVDVSSDGKYQITAGFNDYIFISDDYGNTWKQTSILNEWYDVAISSDGKYMSAVANNSKIYVSNDYGNTWTEKDSVRGWIGITMSSDGRYQTASEGLGRLYISNNYGNTWQITGPVRFWSFITMSSNGKYQTAITYSGGGIFISHDYGNTWFEKETNRGWFDVAMSSCGKYQIAVVSNQVQSGGGNIYYSDNFGITWSPKSTAKNRVGVTASSDFKYIAYTVAQGNIFISTADEIMPGSLTVTDISATGVLYGRAQDLTLNATSTNTVTNSAVTAALQILVPPPTYIQPTASLTNFSPNVFEVGETVTQTLTLNWVQNDAGNLLSGSLLKNNNIVAPFGSLPQTYNVSEPATLTTTTYQLSVNFQTGLVKNNILGFSDTRGQITANSITINRLYNGYYRRWVGSSSTLPANPNNVRTLSLSTSLDTNNTLASPTSPIYIDNKFILIAIPNTRILTNVVTEANENLTSQFSLSSVQIQDAGGTNQSYKLYYLETAVPLNANLTTITITNT